MGKNIGIDARMYGTKHGGIGRYVKELISNLLKIDNHNQYIFFVYNAQNKKQIVDDINTVCHSNKIKFIYAPYRWYSLKEQIMMPRVINKVNINLMHFPHFNVPLCGNNLSFFKKKLRLSSDLPAFIVTIHDLIIHRFPNERATTLPKWLYNIKLKGYKKVMHNAITNSQAVIVPSQATKKDILKFYDIPEDKIKITYEGISELKTKNYELNKNLKLKTKNYLLYTGSFYPHKNIEKLIDAFAILRNKYKLDVSLVLAGKKDYFYEQLKNYINNIQYPISNIHFVGHVEDVALANLYQNASLYIFPSLCEGFGLPPLEAMQFNLPVAASNASSIPEICGNAAFYFDPKNRQDIAAKIYTACTDKTLREKLIANGSKRTKKFSWEQMARETLQVYKEFRL